MFKTVDEYINNFDGEKRAWLTTMVNFMRENFPEIPETISYQVPMYKFAGTHIAFSVAKDHFTYLTIDFDMIEALKKRLPNAKFGKASVKIKYSDEAAIPILFQTSREIVERHRANSPK